MSPIFLATVDDAYKPYEDSNYDKHNPPDCYPVPEPQFYGFILTAFAILVILWVKYGRRRK